MKINKFLFLLILFLPFGFLNGEVWEKDRLMNEYIEKYTPVFNDSPLGATTLTENDPAWYDSDGLGPSSVVGYFSIKLENAVGAKPEPASTIKYEFLGYSSSNSYLQLYLKPASFSYFFSGGEAFGEHIPLTPGVHTIEYKDKNLGNYRVKVKVSLTELKIKVLNSGWTTFTAKYASSPIILVTIFSVEKF